MTPIPRSALVLGLAGTIPFIWGVITLLDGNLHLWGSNMMGQRFVGPYVQLFYGSVILSFMSGVLWGFATKATGKLATIGYVLSVLPALWAFFMTGSGPITASMNLITGFIAVLMLDWFFWKAGLAPEWWMRLRIMISVIVIACLLVAVL
jgi:hypothetical protein